MPRYFFDILDGVAVTDGTGLDLENDQAAYAQAVRVMTRVIQADQPNAWTGHPWMIRVLDAGRHPLIDLSFTATEHTRSGTGPAR